MVLLLALLLSSSPDELTVYRSARGLPAEVAAALPAGFDFRTRMVATRAEAGEPVIAVVPEEVVRRGADLLVRQLREEPPPRCPPCLGINHPPVLEPEVRRETALAAPLFLLPRAPGRVFERLPLPAATASLCPVCRAM